MYVCTHTHRHTHTLYSCPNTFSGTTLLLCQEVGAGNIWRRVRHASHAYLSKPQTTVGLQGQLQEQVLPNSMTSLISIVNHFAWKPPEEPGTSLLHLSLSLSFSHFLLIIYLCLSFSSSFPLSCSLSLSLTQTQTHTHKHTHRHDRVIKKSLGHLEQNQQVAINGHPSCLSSALSPRGSISHILDALSPVHFLQGIVLNVF